MCSMLTSAEKRYQADQIQRHNFFYGVEWDMIRKIQAPFVPRLRSVVDTSYFPTDDIDQPILGDIAPPQGPGGTDSQKDLAFLG